MSSRHTAHPGSGACGPDCRYRSLYEGGQQSLADMASRQAEALGRVGRLRSQIVLGLKRILPNEFTEAERALGQRLSEVPDELLTAYLESFLLLLVGRGHAEAGAVARIQHSLEGLGLDTRGVNSSVGLAEALERAASSGNFKLQELFAPEKPVETANTRQGQSDASGPRRTFVEPTRDNEASRIRSEPARGANETTRAYSSDPNGLTDLFFDEVAYDDVPYDELDHGYTQQDFTPGTDDGSNADYRPGGRERDLETPGAGSSSTGHVAHNPGPNEPGSASTPSTFSDLFGEDETSSGASGNTPIHSVERPSDDLVDLFEGDSGDSLGSHGSVVEKGANAAGNESTTTPERGANSTEERGAASNTQASTLVGPWASRSVPTTGEEVTNRAVAKGGAMKPSLIPQSPKTRQRKTRSAIKAAAMPGESSLDVPVSEFAGGVLDDSMRDRLLAAVCIPRPVFAADLVEMVKSSEIVADWEAEVMSDRSRSVYVIPPKSRHKLRGSLIFSNSYLSDGPVEFQRSLWAQCLGRYRGAKLYEVGVVLHRFSDDVVSYELGNQVAVLRLAMAQGLVGIVMVLDTGLGVGEPARDSLIGALETLMRERLVHIAVLSYVAENIDVIAAVIGEEGEARKWSPSMPITLSKSWEYTNGTGVGVPLLG